MEPSYYIKKNREKFPVFKTPLTKDQYLQILYEGVEKYFIHDQQSGKLEFYNASVGFNPSFKVLPGIPVNITTMAKIGAFVVISVWCYRLSRVGKNVFSYDEKRMKKAISTYPDILKWFSPSPKKSANGSVAKSDGAVSTSNGWEISMVDRPASG